MHWGALPILFVVAINIKAQQKTPAQAWFERRLVNIVCHHARGQQLASVQFLLVKATRDTPAGVSRVESASGN